MLQGNIITKVVVVQNQSLGARLVNAIYYTINLYRILDSMP